MALSLTARKNIRDTEPKKQEHLQRIKNATGLDFAFECDFATVVAKIGKHTFSDRIGEAVHDMYLKVLSNALESRCKDELRKEAVVEACSTNKMIRFQIIDDDEYKKGGNKNGYCRCRMVNGDLVMETKVHSFCTNVEYIMDDFDWTFAGPEGSFPLAARISIHNHQKKREELLKGLSDLAGNGHSFVFECDWAANYKPFEDLGYGGLKLGEVVNWYLVPLTSHLSKLLKDELGKEAVLDKCPNPIVPIRLVIDNSIQTFVKTFFEDGGLTIRIPSDLLGKNVDNCGKDLESQL